MNLLGTILVFGPIALSFVVAGSYAGTMLALKRYHEGEAFTASDAFRVENGDDR